MSARRRDRKRTHSTSATSSAANTSQNTGQRAGSVNQLPTRSGMSAMVRRIGSTSRLPSYWNASDMA